MKRTIRCGVRTSSTPTKRRKLRIAVCVLTGVVITWVVAWGFAQWGAMWLFREEQKQVPELPSRVSSGVRVERFLRWDSVGITDSLWVGHDGWLYQECEFGWPMRSLASRSMNLLDGRGIQYEWCLQPPKWLERQYMGPYPFPVRLIPLGFAINSLIAAGVVMGITKGFVYVGRRVWRAKGGCGVCGYDRAGIAKDAVCPECGEN